MTRRRPQYRETRAVYVISVAADLAGVHPQTLRIYERKGLVRPERTAGNTRRYSPADMERLARIQELTQRYGINLAGVKMILDLETQLERVRHELDRMADRVQKMEASLADEMRRVSREAGAILPVSTFRRYERMQRALSQDTTRRRGPAIPLGPVTIRH